MADDPKPPRPGWGAPDRSFKSQGAMRVEIVEQRGPHQGDILIELSVHDARDGLLQVHLARDALPVFIAQLTAVQAEIERAQVVPPQLAQIIEKRRRQ
jgi:hypothetical protein